MGNEPVKTTDTHELDLGSLESKTGRSLWSWLVEARKLLAWKRGGTLWPSLISRAVAVAAGLAVGALLIIGVGADPIKAYQALWEGSFGSIHSVTETIVKATPLLLAGLGMLIAYRGSVWNIGAEGQLQLGALAATVLGIVLGGLPAVVLLPLVIIGAFLAGGLWAAIAGWLKAKLEVNEVITTIMMNFVAILTVNWVMTGPLQDPTSGGVPITPYIAEAAQLPRLIPRTRLHAGLLLALICVGLVYVLLFKTTLGYQIRAVGANPRAARLAGIDVTRTILVAMVLSGGLAGLAGMSEICGLHHRLMGGFSPGYGFTAMVVALLGKLHPLGTVVAAILFAALVVGADAMTRAVRITTSLVFIIQGVVILFVLGSEFFVQKRGS